MINRLKNINGVNLVIMTGISCSGKSTLAREIRDQLGYVYFNTDTLRANGYSEGHVWAHIIKYSKENLQNGKSVIIDATMLNRKIRSKMINTSKGLIVNRISIFKNTKLEECLKRNSIRQPHLEEEYIISQNSGIDIPRSTEGFNYLFRIDA